MTSVRRSKMFAELSVKQHKEMTFMELLEYEKLTKEQQSAQIERAKKEGTLLTICQYPMTPRTTKEHMLEE